MAAFSRIFDARLTASCETVAQKLTRTCSISSKLLLFTISDLTTCKTVINTQEFPCNGRIRFLLEYLLQSLTANDESQEIIQSNLTFRRFNKVLDLFRVLGHTGYKPKSRFGWFLKINEKRQISDRNLRGCCRTL